MNKPPLFIISFFIIVSCASANINVSIQSDNSLYASIRSISDYTDVAGINQSESIDLPYQSYEFSISMDTADITYDDFWGFLGGITGKGIFLILIVFMLFLIYAVMKGLR